MPHPLRKIVFWIEYAQPWDSKVVNAVVLLSVLAVYYFLAMASHYLAYTEAVNACAAKGNPDNPCWNQILLHWNWWLPWPLAFH
jgi:hypothetical protein